MSTLVIQLPARTRLRRDADASGGAQPGASELAYVVTPDGLAVSRQGRGYAAVLPKTESAVAVVSDADVSWHRITVPKAPAPRLRAAIAGVLEEQLLEDAESLHFALAPKAAPGQSGWVAVVDKAWLKAELSALDKAGIPVERVVPVAWPEDTPLGHFGAPQGDDAGAPMRLTWSDRNGVTTMVVHGALARQMLQGWAGQGARWTAHPAVAAPAERLLGTKVLAQGDDQRMLQAMRSLWNLLQFDLAPKHRGTVALRNALRRWRSAAWRPVRLGLAALVALQVLGLNLWAWHQDRQVAAKREAAVALLRTTYPQVRAIVDAPAQMARETELLRTAAGVSGEADLETLLGVAASAWPDGLAPMQTMNFEAGRLSFAAAGWSEAQIALFRNQLSGSGWNVAFENGALTLSRASGRPS
jgi:general secretion pathway protein L